MKIKRLFQVVFLSTTLAIIAGCASVPSQEMMRSETASFQLPQSAPAGKAIVYVVRPSGVGGLVRFNVFLDDQEASSEMGHTRSSQYVYFNVAPGKHKIYSKAENWAETQIDAKSGDVVYIQQEPSMGLIIARNNLSTLDELQGKYQVKKLTVGTILKTDK